MFKFKRSKSLSRTGGPGADSPASPSSSSPTSQSAGGGQQPPVRRGSDPTNAGSSSHQPRASTPTDSNLSYSPFTGQDDGTQSHVLPDIAHVSPFIAPDYNRIVSGTIPSAPALPIGSNSSASSSPPGSLARKTVTFNDDNNTVHRPPPSPASTVTVASVHQPHSHQQQKHPPAPPQTAAQSQPPPELDPLPVLPPSLGNMSRHDLESLVHTLHTDALASRMLVEQARASEAVHKTQLDKVALRAFKSITTLREKVAAVEAELADTKDQLAQTSTRFARVMAILAMAVPGLVPGGQPQAFSSTDRGKRQDAQGAVGPVQVMEQVAAGGQPV